VSLYDWLLFLHVAAAFALVAGLASFGVLVLGDGGPALGRALVAPAIALWNAGGIGVLVLGLGLAIDVDAYRRWDGWILGAIVLYAVATELGRRARLALDPAVAGADPATSAPRLTLPSQAVTLHWLRTAAVIGVLILMIYKPGA
jgi:hypothetical protein